MFLDRTNLERIKNLKKEKTLMKQGGGEKRLKTQNENGKLSVWQRINYLVDPESFVEIGGFVELRNRNFNLHKKKVPGDGVVTGFGTINGRQVYIAAQDFTVMGGSLGEMHGEKIAYILEKAVQNGFPVIMLNDSVGARIHEGIGALSGYGQVFFRNTMASGVIPQISVIMGPCAGGAVYSPGITDFILMVEHTSNMFITGPEVIRSVTGETITKEALGGSEVHMNNSGVAAFVGKDDESTLDWLKKLLSYLPSNNLEYPPVSNIPQGPGIETLPPENMVPSASSKPYDIHQVIISLVDNNSFIELQPGFARNIIIGFARLKGQTLGIVANNPFKLAGCLDVDASDKAARFVRFCDAFNIPLLTLVDVPGFLPGVDQEYAGIIRHGAKLLYAYSEATVPKLTVILRKAYGGAYICMCSKHLGADMVLAWPGSEIAVMGPKGAVSIVFKQEIASAEDQTQVLRACEEEYITKISNPRIAAALGYVDDIIEPGETRNILHQCLTAHLGKRMEIPKRKHGNIPL